jgi:transposase
MSKQEFIIEGWDEIANLFQVSRQTMIKRKDELQQFGAIFYKMKGKPPRLYRQSL